MSSVDHKQVIAGLTPAQRSQLMQRSNRAGLQHLAGYAAAMAGTTTLVLTSGAWRPVFMLMHGVLICFLFTLLHETSHRTPFVSRGINDAVGHICGFLVFLEPSWFRSFHMAHHRYTNEPDHDPELAAHRPSSVPQYLLYLSGIPEILDRLRVLVCNATTINRAPYIRADARVSVMRRARLQVAFYVVLIAASAGLGSAVLLYVWIIPFVIAGPFLRAYLLAEHAGCPQDPSMFANTRTVLTNPLVRFVAWNMPYHAEHHAYPGLPFHQLAAFHEHTKAHLLVTDPGYVRFNRDFAANISSAERLP